MEIQSDNSREGDSANSWSEFRVRFSSEELAQLASELREETIADVHLSLLTYWICESKDNYEEAKVHIRELNIDQGYLTDRITNQSLRKLLAETRPMRPRYESDLAYANIVRLSRHSSTATLGAQWPKRTSSLLSSKSWPKPAPSFWRGRVLQERKPSAPIRGVLSRPIKLDEDPLMKTNPNPISKSAGTTSSIPLSSSLLSPSSSRGCPPNTPNRPAPLNFRSRGSDSTTTGASIRTVSTPLYASQLSRSASSPSPRKVERTSRRLFPLHVGSLTNISETTVTSIDIFADEISKYRHHRDSSVAAAVEDDIMAMFGPSELTENHRKFALMTDEVSGTNLSTPSDQSEYRTMDRCQHDEYDPYRYEDKEDGDQSVDGDVFGPFHYAASASEDERVTSTSTDRPGNRGFAVQDQYSLPSARYRPFPISFPYVSDAISSHRECDTSGLYKYGNEEVVMPNNSLICAISTPEEGASATYNDVRSNNRESTSLSQYTFPSREVSSLPFRPEPFSSNSKRQTAMQTCRERRSPNLAATSHFHRPLPLRSYESDAYLYPTFRAQAQSRQRRPSSVNASPVRGGGSGTLGRLDEDETTRRVREDRTVSARPHISMAPSETPTLTDGDLVPAPPSPIADAFKSVTSAFIGQLLQKTREQGAQLPGVRNKSFSIRDTLWRNANGHLIIAIYGRKDIELSQTDRDFVDKIAKEMREGVVIISGYEWVGEMFLQE